MTVFFEIQVITWVQATAVFCQKPGLGLADLAVVYQLEDWFMAGNSLNSCPDTGSEIKSAFSYIIKQK